MDLPDLADYKPVAPVPDAMPNNLVPRVLDPNDFRWSFSQWETFTQCPAKWKFQRLYPQLRRPPGPAAARGLDMHDRCEKYIKGQIGYTELRFGNTSQRFGSKKPAIIAEKYVHVLDEFRDHPNGDRHCELKLSLDQEWYVSGGITHKSWLVMVLDAIKIKDGIGDVGEWKSGQPKETHGDQRKMYALGSLRRWLGLEEVRVTTYYLEDTAPPQRLVVKASAEQKLKDLWKARVEYMQADAICAPRPGDYCQFMCDFARSKGGPCEFGR